MTDLQPQGIQFREHVIFEGADMGAPRYEQACVGGKLEATEKIGA